MSDNIFEEMIKEEEKQLKATKRKVFLLGFGFGVSIGAYVLAGLWFGWKAVVVLFLYNFSENIYRSVTK